MIPKILGFGAAILAVLFILALPSVFEAEPANDVEPIRFGPGPVQRLASATLIEKPPPPSPPQPELLSPIPIYTAVVESPVPALTSGGGDEGGIPSGSTKPAGPAPTAVKGDAGGGSQGEDDDEAPKPVKGPSAGQTPAGDDDDDDEEEEGGSELDADFDDEDDDD